jgi:hypothetical protein
MAHRAAWIAALVAAATTGCASMRVARERNEYLAAQLDGLRYAKPMPEVWPEVLRLLAEMGYPLAEADAEAIGRTSGFLSSIFSPSKETHIEPLGGRSSLFPAFRATKAVPAEGPGRWWLETGWSDRAALRYRADGSTDGTTCQVTFTAIAADTAEKGHDGERHRDLEMELDLARRVDPEAAARIEAGLEAFDAKRGG